MAAAPHSFAASEEALVVLLAARGDRRAFEEIVRRRQSWLRNLLRRLCRDPALADDLAQQVFLQAWRTLGQLRDPRGFAAWLKRTAINVWLQHLRRPDALHGAVDIEESPHVAEAGEGGVGIDLDQALALLPDAVRLCIVLSYHERMSHAEIAETAAIPLGTVKSHIRRGTERLRQLLAAYHDPSPAEEHP